MIQFTKLEDLIGVHICYDEDLWKCVNVKCLDDDGDEIFLVLKNLQNDEITSAFINNCQRHFCIDYKSLDDLSCTPYCPCRKCHNHPFNRHF